MTMNDASGQRLPMTETERICGRHMARLLTDLEAINCPQVILDAVKTALRWLRHDLVTNETKGNI